MRSVFVLLFISGALWSQTPGWDTTKYHKFNSTLIVGIFQSHRNFNNQFDQTITPDSLAVSHHNYYAESKEFTGIELSYDKFSLALSLKSTPQKGSSGKGNTKAFGLVFNYGSNRWTMENSYRSFKGFYDRNTINYDTTIKETGNYNYQPHFTNALFRSKFLYFTNHKKFSIKAGSTCNYRQVKSAATWVLSANVNYNHIYNDTSFFPAATRSYYGDYAYMNGLNVFGLSLNAGAAVNIVWWRAFIMQAMFIVGPEQQWRRYFYSNAGSTSLSYFSLSGELRGTIGLNFKRCYILFFSRNDFAWYYSSFVGIRNRSLGGGVILGWRFNPKTPEIYKRFQKTKLYSYL